MERNMAATKLVGHIARGNVLDDLGFSPEESAVLRMKADLHSKILKTIAQRHYTQADLQRHLGEPRPRISDLMRGKISKFSLETLVGYAERLGLQPQLKTAEFVGTAQ
jgi:predicted XRE-type DNA-binding protein